MVEEQHPGVASRGRFARRRSVPAASTILPAWAREHSRTDRLAASGEHDVFKTMTWQDAVSNFGAQWENLINERSLNPSHHPGWLHAAASAAGLTSRLQVLVQLTEDGQLVAVVPHYLETERMLGLPVTILNLATNISAYHTDIVSRTWPEAILAELLNSTPGWHVFCAAGLQPEGPAASAIQTIANDMHATVLQYSGDESPYLSINGPWTDFVASKPKKDRYRIRRGKQMVTGRPGVELHWIQEPDDVSGLLDDIIAIEGKSWKFDEHVEIRRDGVEAAYYTELLPFLARRGALLACVLYVSGSPVAYSLCCRWNGWVGLLKTSYDASFRHISPGSVVVAAVLEKAFDSRASEFDFLGNADLYKLRWSHQLRSHSNVFVFGSSGRARALSAVKRLRGRLVA